MNTDEFWNLIDLATKNAAAKTHRDMAKALTLALLPLPEQDIIQWDALLHAYRDLADTSKMYAAAVVINGGSSDDCFMDFRVWVIMQGRAAYEAALADPDSLAKLDIPFNWAEWELCGYAGAYAFTLKQHLQFLSTDPPGMQTLLQKYAHRPNLLSEVWQSALDYSMHHQMRPKEWQPDMERKQLAENVASLLHQRGRGRDMYDFPYSMEEHQQLMRQLGQDLVIDREECSPIHTDSVQHIWEKRLAWENEEDLRKRQRLPEEHLL